MIVKVKFDFFKSLLDISVDLWSAGCILAEMIIGKPLFPGTNNFEQWNKIVQVVGSPNQSFIEQLPEGIKNFVEHAPRYEPKPWTEIISDSAFSHEQTQKRDRLPMCNCKLCMFIPLHSKKDQIMLKNRFFHQTLILLAFNFWAIFLLK
jgi:serine/threonine protein kinase